MAEEMAGHAVVRGHPDHFRDGLAAFGHRAVALRPGVWGGAGGAKMLATSATSTTCPAYMTATRWQSWATTPMSWGTKRMERPCRPASSARMARIWPCTVTSRAVVGSSARSRDGLQISAMAIITRWRMPPESAWGKARRTDRGSGRRTASSISRQASVASARLALRWARTTSRIWLPTVKTGLRLFMGSWKIMEMRSPRSLRISVRGSFSRSRPSKRISPPSMLPGGVGMMRRTARESTDLPQPVSPTRPMISPWFTAREALSSTRARPW